MAWYFTTVSHLLIINLFRMSRFKKLFLVLSQSFETKKNILSKGFIQIHFNIMLPGKTNIYFEYDTSSKVYYCKIYIKIYSKEY